MGHHKNQEGYNADFVLREQIRWMNFLKVFVTWMLRILVCVILLLSFQLHIINAEIPSASMENTIMIGDRIFGLRKAYDHASPERYDVIIFKDAVSGKYLIKRVIGLPGETLTFKDGYVYVEGQNEPLDDSFCMEQGVTDAGLSESITIPEDCYFVLGDNRLDSYDSRYWTNDAGEYIPFVVRDAIVAKAVFRYFPVSKMGFIE